MENAVKKMESVIHWIPATTPPEKDEFYIDYPMEVMVALKDGWTCAAKWTAYCPIGDNVENDDWEFSPIGSSYDFSSSEVEYWAFMLNGPAKDAEVKTE